ncbi:helix-turn-helix domain-containing protein [Paenibacillus algicola]|uniref:helix-turn-helix domain-containing protein n=1 Tax=Paenibacillus algicola TaxID=2565926 RepID=UPI0010FD99E8|nr:helix-turn-helix transcriptional regulator [Paenibacillus algicola]
MIGEVLKRTRTIYGYNATEMSLKLGISKSYLSEIENNKKQPSLEILQKYSDIYGIKLSSLILLSEDYNDASKTSNSQEFVKKLMMRFINFMSKERDDDDTNKEET